MIETLSGQLYTGRLMKCIPPIDGVLNYRNVYKPIIAMILEILFALFSSVINL